MELVESRIVRPSVNMLPMEEIKNVLNSNVQALDTDYVGGVEACDIAKAYEGNREAVRTAYYLGNRPAKDYLTVDVDPSEKIKILDQDYQEEMATLKLEIYRLYEILNQQLGATYRPEAGFLETFKDITLESTTAQVVNIGSNISELRPAQLDFAVAKEYIVIDDGAEKFVAQIDTVDQQIYTLTGSVDSTERSVTLYKIKGEMLKNTYSFSKTEYDVLAGSIHSVVLGDYVSEEKQFINQGYATDILLRANMFALEGEREKAVLDSVRVYIARESLQASSQLVCKIYEIEYFTSDNKPVLRLLGTSQACNIFSSQWVTFQITNEGLPVTVTDQQRLLVAFECNTANNFQIMVGKGLYDSDLHTNRTVYAKTEEGYLKLENTKDIIMGLNFATFLPEVTTPYKNGLYTSQTFSRLKDTNKKAQLQVKLKNIDKALVQSPTVADAHFGFILNKELISTSREMVVGRYTATYDHSNNNTYFTDEHLAVYPGEEVYFIPIKAQLVATSELFEDHYVREVVAMTPVRMADGYLIFECELPEHVKRFNVQVAYFGLTQSYATALESIAVSLI